MRSAQECSSKKTPKDIPKIHMASNVEYINLDSAIERLFLDKDSQFYQNVMEQEVYLHGILREIRQQHGSLLEEEESQYRRQRLNNIMKELDCNYHFNKLASVWELPPEDDGVLDDIITECGNMPIRAQETKRARFLTGIGACSTVTEDLLNSNISTIVKNPRAIKSEIQIIPHGSDTVNGLPVFMKMLPKDMVYNNIPCYSFPPVLVKRARPIDIEDDHDKIYSAIIKKHIPRMHKVYQATIAAKQGLCKKMAHLCSREVRRCYFRLARNAKDQLYKSRRATKEMVALWKKLDREERELRKREEKITLERTKAEEESRKLDFLINQTELYSHFISKKRDAFNDFAEGGKASIDTAGQRAQSAYEKQQEHARAFDSDSPLKKAKIVSEHIEQPAILKCQLKAYQLQGLNWLANLYEQGINGILADEMGLGKTVQSISLMAHLAEKLDTWGPFIIITPASTLHNWHQELMRFVPALKVMPYWGNINERKTIRRFWGGQQLGKKESPFHVLVTSYQLVVTDEKYLSRIKWQYMILDEAQAIKSSGSNRWRTLLSFNCRNRLLLTGTPIQNTMQELWALLHFIMPTLFDSHDEFSEWFSKDIESHAENKSTLDEHRLSRLHMVLKPFMLRRIKRDVGNELSEKIELDVSCELTPKQEEWYNLIKKKLQKEHGALLDRLNTVSSTNMKNVNVDHLANLVMQFRKICNHPELIEKTEIQSPFYQSTYNCGTAVPSEIIQGTSLLDRGYPSLITEEISSIKANVNNKLNVFSVVNCNENSEFGVLYNANYSPQEIHDHIANGISKPKLDPYTRRYLDECNEQHNIAELGDTVMSPMIEKSHKYQFITNLYIPNVSAATMRLFDSDTSVSNWRGDRELVEIERRMRSLGSSHKSLPLIQYPVSILKPDIQDLVQASGKMIALDALLLELKQEKHRVLIYFQMTKMMDLMEDYLGYKGYTYLRLDGSSKISERRDMVADWQNNEDIFIFLLSTRAGGLGINLTAADTVVFYDSDWNPTIDQQAMDRAHRLGQMKQVTVYRLITKNTIEERILQRASQKSEIQKVVISGELRTRDLVSLLMEEKDST